MHSIRKYLSKPSLYEPYYKHVGFHVDPPCVYIMGPCRLV